MCNLSEAIEVVKNALKEDRDTNKFGYYEAWQANIAMAFIDECHRLDPVTRRWDKEVMRRIANNAAKNFLNTLINQ